jgi:hypothetical protein
VDFEHFFDIRPDSNFAYVVELLSRHFDSPLNVFLAINYISFGLGLKETRESRQEVARSRGLGLPSGPLLPGCARLWLIRGVQAVLSQEEKGALRPKTEKTLYLRWIWMEEVPKRVSFCGFFGLLGGKYLRQGK